MVSGAGDLATKINLHSITRHPRVLETARAYLVFPPSMAIAGGNSVSVGREATYSKLDPRLRGDDE